MGMMVANLPSPNSPDDWKAEPYRGLQEKIEAYKATHQGIKIEIELRNILAN
jgi:hypothetical protein